MKFTWFDITTVLSLFSSRGSSNVLLDHGVTDSETWVSVLSGGLSCCGFLCLSVVFSARSPPSYVSLTGQLAR